MEAIEEEKRIALRKLHESQQEKIDLLIAKEEDSKVRLTLMVMSSINKSISANTDLTYAVHKEVSGLKSDLEVHINETEAAKNQGLGAYRIMKIVGPALWVVMGSTMSLFYNSYNDFQSETDELLTSIDRRLINIEARVPYSNIPSFIDIPINKSK